jgi:DeoR family glycerol-3-phosphate regulon repressor
MEQQDASERTAIKARQTAILERIASEGRTTVIALAETLGASRETVRRDLTTLAEQGRLRKVHGGAVRLQAALEDPFGARLESNRDAKRRIGERAAELFTSGDSLLIDSGSTTILFAEALANKNGITVVTNSQFVAQAASKGPGENRVFLLGGQYHHEGAETLGPMTNDQIQMLSTDHAVLTVGAVDATGRFMDFIADAAYTARAMMARARQVTVLVDSSKLEQTALFQVCTAHQVSRVVTDAPPPPAVMTSFLAAGVEVIIARE